MPILLEKIRVEKTLISKTEIEKDFVTGLMDRLQDYYIHGHYREINQDLNYTDKFF